MITKFKYELAILIFPIFFAITFLIIVISLPGMMWVMLDSMVRDILGMPDTHKGYEPIFFYWFKWCSRVIRS